VNLAAAETLIGRSLARSPLLVAVFDADLRIIWANEAAERHRPGFPALDWRGRQLAEVLPEIDAGLIEQSLRWVLATGEPVLDQLVTSGDGTAEGGVRYWTSYQLPVSAPEAGGGRVVIMMRDVTERALSQRRLALADQASARIGRTLDTAQTAEELLDVAVPQLADVGAVDLLATVIEGDDLARARHQRLRLRRVALRWPAETPAPAGYARRTSTELYPDKAYHKQFLSGEPIFLPDLGAMSADQIWELDTGQPFHRMMAAKNAGAHSVMIIPLIARGVIMGAVTLYRLLGSRRFTRADLSLARDLVSRAALSIDNARLYTRERATALALQRGMLPRSIPRVPGLELCQRYVPAETAAEVGGDWFDVITLGPGRSALIVGDVSGHDMRAASVMGQLRTATRTLAGLDLAPATVLGRLDQVTADLTDHETFATCVYAVHDAGTGDWDIARAGHPPPAVAGPGRQTRFLDLPPGLPLGLGTGRYEAIRTRLPPRSTLLLYTDGLIESLDGDIATGMAGLADALTPLSKVPLSDACDVLLASLAPKPADDIAVLMART
jgi:GAF domain-containing protein